MKKERLIILLGILVALVFFYLGLNEWLKTKEEQVQPPPVTVKPSPQKQETPQETPPTSTPEAKQPPKSETEKAMPQQEQEKKQASEENKKDLIAQKIREEKSSRKGTEVKPESTPQKKEVKTTRLKTYTVQVGAFVNKESAEKQAQKARKMGYKTSIVEEENFYKVKVTVSTDNIEAELRKLKSTFGGAILK